MLSLVSDAARANKKLARWLGSNLPANSLLSWHHCNAHEVNHTVEPVWRGLHINELFCSAKVLHAGNTFFDLITHVANEILENMEVVYGQNPQSSADQQYAESVLALAYPVWILNDDLDDDDLEKHRRRRILKEKLGWLKLIFNGDWRGPLRHYCRLGCPCACGSAQAVRQKAVIVFLDVVLGARPSVPALSRWCKCSKTATWFFLADAIHKLLSLGYRRMYGQDRFQVESRLNNAVMDLQQSTDPISTQSGGANSFLMSDLPVPKILRARALKSVSWLLDPDTLTELAIAVSVTRPVELMLHWLFDQQHVSCQCFKPIFMFPFCDCRKR